MEFSINYKLCEIQYIINIQSYQYANKITLPSTSFLFACFFTALEYCKYARMIFHCAKVLVVLSICALRGNIADNAMQMDVNKSLYPFYIHGRNFVVKYGGTTWCETNIVIGSMQK